MSAREMAVQCVRLEAFDGPSSLRLRDVSSPPLAPGHALVAVRAVGVCYHDLMATYGQFPRTRLPITMGHEIAGDVLEVDGAVTHLKPGDRVASVQGAGCGTCHYCGTGREPLCRHGVGFFGETIDGGFADLVSLPARGFCQLHTSIPYDVGSILACAIGTALHALKAKARVALGETVLITGAGGGVGIHAVQLAKAAGARVMAITGSPHKVEAIRTAGADHVVVSGGQDFSAQVRGIAGQRGVQVALEIVGAETFPWTIRCLEPGGRLVFVGNVTGKPVELKPAVVILKDLQILGATNTTPEELDEVITLVAADRIQPHVAATLPLAKLPEALERLQRERPLGRFVVIPNGQTHAERV